MKGVARTPETAFKLVMLAIGCAIAYISWGYGFGTVAKPGPGLYPFLLGAAIVVFSTMLLASHGSEAETEPLFEAGGARTFMLMAVTFCLWVLAMPLLGYVVVTFIATWAFAKALGLEGWRKPLVVSAATAATLYLLFGYWLYIDLPRGIFG